MDRAWFRYQFEHEDTEAFLRVLAAHQYDNGGFGGLVHEFEYQGPCLKCTEHAFRYLYYLKEKPPAAHPLIQRMMGYVLERYRPEIGEWGQLLEPEVNDGCHVWWWTYEKDERSYGGFDERVRAYNPNGQAALAAFVALYGELVPDGRVRQAHPLALLCAQGQYYLLACYDGSREVRHFRVDHMRDLVVTGLAAMTP